MTQTSVQAEVAAAPSTRIGVVESDRRDKTRKVVVRYQAKHPKYGKYIKRRTTLQVHDEANESRLGDIVEVVECRPLSKTKSWRLVRVVDRRSTEQVCSGSAGDVAAGIQV
jgi:small subunit ribosomal protein S17